VTGSRFGTSLDRVTIELDDAEVFATRDLRLAALDGHDMPPWRIGLARLGVRFATFGDDSPIRRAGAVGRNGTLNGEPIVYVWRGMSERDQALTAWHEYAHGLIVREGLSLACHAERWCTRYAAAMVCPADSMRRAWRDADRDLLGLAALRPAASASVLTLRLGDLALARVALYGRKGPLRPLVDQREAREVGRIVDIARRSGFAEGAAARAWRLPDDVSRVGVLLAA
jgi:hypothetical protein